MKSKLKPMHGLLAVAALAAVACTPVQEVVTEPVKPPTDAVTGTITDDQTANDTIASMTLASLTAPAVQTHFTRKAAGNQCAAGSSMLPLSRAGQVKTASHLAALVEQSLAADPSGNGYVSGTNMTPNMYVASVNKARVRVTGVGALPAYLRSLVAVPMPKGQKIRMSRVKYTKGRDCVERFELDTTTGFAREAHPGEMAFIDPNDSTIVFAGDCTNSPFEVVTVNQSVPVVNVLPHPDQRDSAERCVWHRVKPGEEGLDLTLRIGSPTDNRILKTWKAADLNWQTGPKPGRYAKLCFTESHMRMAEAAGEDLVVCNPNNHVTFRHQRDFALFRAQPDFPIEDEAKVGASW